MATLVPDALVVDVAEMKCRQVMATRAALTKIPATHKQRADMLAWVDALLDEFNLLVLGR